MFCKLLSLADKIVHVILPLADEYQTTKTLEKANQFLAKKSKILEDKISSAQVIQNILQAELYRLDAYLDESIAIASRKCFERLVQHPKFNEITQETRLKIMTKRWKDMDEVFKTTVLRNMEQNVLTSTRSYLFLAIPLPQQLQMGLTLVVCNIFQRLVPENRRRVVSVSVIWEIV